MFSTAIADPQKLRQWCAIFEHRMGGPVACARVSPKRDRHAGMQEGGTTTMEAAVRALAALEGWSSEHTTATLAPLHALVETQVSN